MRLKRSFLFLPVWAFVSLQLSFSIAVFDPFPNRLPSLKILGNEKDISFRITQPHNMFYVGQYSMQEEIPKNTSGIQYRVEDLNGAPIKTVRVNGFSHSRSVGDRLFSGASVFELDPSVPLPVSGHLYSDLPAGSNLNWALTTGSFSLALRLLIASIIGGLIITLVAFSLIERFSKVVPPKIPAASKV